MTVEHIQRWNAGTMRRYRLTGGAILVTNTNRSCVIIPAWCHHISRPISRADAARILREAR